MIKNIIMPFIIFSFLLVSNSSAFEYNIDYYITGGTGTNIDTDPISFYAESGDTVLSLNVRASLNVTTGTYSYNLDFESPYPNVVSTGSDTLSVNYSCKNLGTPLISYIGSQVIEGRGTMTNDADDSTIYGIHHFNVTTTDRYIRIFSTPNINDTENYVANVYRAITAIATEPSTPAEITTNLNSADFSNCADIGILTRFPQSYNPAAKQEFGYVVLNSTAGVINYSMATGTPEPVARFVYYPIDNPTAVTDLGTGISKSGSVTLDKNRIYVFAYGTVGVTGNRFAPDMNFTIDLGLPNYICPSYGECIDGFHERTCIDSNGLQPDRTEVRSCSIIVLENASLGFEEFVRESDIWKCSPSWFFGTSYTLNQTLRDTPSNWTIGENSFAKRDFLKLTSEWATEGSRSLMMWYIPPKMGEVILNGTGYPTSCGNVTGGTLPFIYRNISNTSFSVDFGVTFPAENMLLNFDVKGCENQVKQHSSFSPLAWGNVSIIQYWPESCYAESCNTVPDSNYIFNIVNNATGQSIIGTPKIARATILRPDQISIDLSNLGIEAGIVYRVVFAVYPENLDDRSGNCVMIDNVRYERIAESFIDVFLKGSCQSQCVGNDFYEATQLTNGACSVRKITLGCAGTEITDALDQGNSICDGNTLIRLNPVTKLPENVECEFGCDDNVCLTEEETSIIESLYAPHPMIQSILTEWQLPLIGNEIVWFFNSLFMYVNYLALGLGFGISLVVKGDSKHAKDMYIPFIVTIVIILVSSTFGGFYPLEVGIPLIVFIGILLWKTSEGIVGGHGQGGG